MQYLECSRLYGKIIYIYILFMKKRGFNLYPNGHLLYFKRIRIGIHTKRITNYYIGITKN
jgi:hypothetical protein